ncbi:hypothetical protein [Nocardia carnea]|uniref:hypothetical protein n=1 Tax=Nocardia carnea TaxID=37328 RepID=UPI002454DB44|nr:hypothetical protein [Nocardia carnea]
MSRNSNQLSVAELLARNGAQPTSGGGGRRRRGGRGVSVTELTGDLPAVEGGSAHAAPDAAEEPADAPADTGYAPQSYAEQDYSAEPSHSPMSGPITVYNPLAPYPGDTSQDDFPARPAPPDPYAPASFPAEDSAPRRGRRRRADPDDDAEVYPAADPASQPWETGPPLPSGGRAARRRAAEAAEAAAAAETAEPVAEAHPGYELPPRSAGSGAFPASFPAPAPPGAPEFGGPEFGRPEPGPQRAGPESGPPRLGPPLPATEAWQAPAPATEAWPAPAPASEPRPALERRRRGSRPLPDPAPWPEPAVGQANADQATFVWSLAEQSKGFGPGTPDLDAPPLDHSDRGGARGGRNAHPAGKPEPGYPEPPAEQIPDDGFRNTDMYATDVHGPMPPAPGPMRREHGSDTGEFEPDSDIYAVPEDDDLDAEPRSSRAHSALTGRLGAATEKFTALRSRAAGSRKRDSEEVADPRKQWIMLGAQSLGAALAGMLAFKGFEQLWALQPLAALALAVVVILGLVALVRILRRTDDILSTVIAVVVGVFVTLGPLAFLLSAG